jgi:hypothetical protein
MLNAPLFCTFWVVSLVFAVLGKERGPYVSSACLPLTCVLSPAPSFTVFSDKNVKHSKKNYTTSVFCTARQ